MATLGKTTITDLSVYNTIHGKIEQADKVTISAGSINTWRNMLVTTGENDIFSVPNVYANYSLGALKAKTVYITGSASNTTAHITSDTTDNMYFSVKGVIPLVINTTSTTNPCIRASNSLKGAVDLGSDSNKWRNVYATSFNGTSASLTGPLTITGTDASTANLHFGRTSYNYISGPSGSTIHMCPGGIAKDSTHGYIFSASEFYPGTTNAYSIGSSSKQWNNIYGKTLYENGTSLANKYAAASHTHSKLSSTSILFTPAETALTPDQVYTLLGGTTIKRGTWNYAGNGYISNDTTGCGVIDLAGTTVIQADGGSSTAYTQLYLTPSTGTTTGCKTNEIFMFNNNGSGYKPSWTRVLTNRNYTDYCAAKSHTHTKSQITDFPVVMEGKNGSTNDLNANFTTSNVPYIWRLGGSNPNLPTGCSYGNLVHFTGTVSDTAFELLGAYTSDKLLFRRGTWKSDGTGSINTATWKQIAFTSDIPTSLTNTEIDAIFNELGVTF